MYAVLWRDVKLIARFYIEGRIPRVDVANDAVDAELARRMGVAHHLLADRIVAQLAAPGLCPAKEDALVAGQSINERRRLAVQRRVIGIERQREPAQIGDVFAHRQCAVHMHIGFGRQRLE
jgi:hypothetical protein